MLPLPFVLPLLSSFSFSSFGRTALINDKHLIVFFTGLHEHEHFPPEKMEKIVTSFHEWPDPRWAATVK